MAKPRLKVLILSHSSELSGAERSMLDLFAHWDKQGKVEPHFIIRHPVKNLGDEIKRHGWVYTPVYYTNWSQRNPSPRAEDVYRNALFNTEAVFEIEKIIKKVKPDLVATNTIVAPWAALAAHFQRVPHVWFVREYGDVDHRHIFELGRDKMMEDINTLSSLIVTNSKTLGQHLAGEIDKSKIVALYTPFDIDQLIDKSKQKAANPFRDQDSLKLVFTGKIAAGKGQVEAVEALAKLKKAGYKVELCIIGKALEEGDEQQLLEAIAKHGLNNNVHLIGHIANPLAVLKFADVGVMASKQEAFGRVTFEYMALGLPVVGSNSGATPEMVQDGVNGYLYKVGDSNDLAAKLTNYAKDKQLASQHGQTTKALAEKMMRGANNAEALLKKLQQLLDQKIELPVPLNFSHRWLEYPGVANQYIRDSEVISLKRLLKHRLRHRGKIIYLWTAKRSHFDPLKKAK